MSEIKKFEVGKTYRDTSAYGSAFFTWKCIKRTNKTAMFENMDVGGVRKFGITTIGNEEVIRAEHIYARNIAA